MSKGGVGTVDRLVPDELWEAIEPLLPKHRPSAKGGRPRLSDRKCLAGIVFVLRHGIGWEHRPQELGCGSGMTCWRRLRQWQEAGVWQQLHEAMLAKPNNAEQRGTTGLLTGDGRRSDRQSPERRSKTGPNPTDRRKCGSKRHLLTERHGIPLAVRITGANRHDVMQRLPLVDAIPAVRGKPGRPRRRPDWLLAGLAVGRTGCWPIAATTRRSTETNSTPAASLPRSPGGAARTAAAWASSAGASSAGRSSGRTPGSTPGSTPSGGWPSAATGCLNSMKHSTRSPPPSSASTSYNGFVRSL